MTATFGTMTRPRVGADLHARSRNRALGLAAIIEVLRFQAIRLRELPAEPDIRAA